jgi:hypothetical protein
MQVYDVLVYDECAASAAITTLIECGGDVEIQSDHLLRPLGGDVFESGIA